MALDLPKTSSKRDGPLVKQFSVFLANKVGAMHDILKLLNTHDYHVIAMSVSESTDSAIARLIVSDPEGVEKLFRQNNIAFGACHVVVVEMREVADAAHKLGLDLPSNAIGKDFLPGGALFAAAPSGTGYQVSLFGLAGILLAIDEGFELNILGLNIGIDAAVPALKLPAIGRLGLDR